MMPRPFVFAGWKSLTRRKDMKVHIFSFELAEQFVLPSLRPIGLVRHLIGLRGRLRSRELKMALARHKSRRVNAASTQIVLHGPITKDTESDAQGVFAVDGLPPGTYQIEANAPRLYAALAVEVRAGTSSTVPVEMNVAAVTGTTSPQLTRLKAMDCAFRRKVHHA